jgi:hypothetical protein
VDGQNELSSLINAIGQRACLFCILEMKDVTLHFRVADIDNFFIVVSHFTLPVYFIVIDPLCIFLDLEVGVHLIGFVIPSFFLRIIPLEHIEPKMRETRSTWLDLLLGACF